MKLQTIASVCECSRSSVKRALTVLRDRGFIDIKGGAQKLHGKGHRQTCNRYYLLDTRQSQGQIGVISAPICAFCHHSFGGFSIVFVQPCPLFSCSGSKLGQRGFCNYKLKWSSFWLRVFPSYKYRNSRS